MEISVGGRKLLDTAILLVPEDEDAWIELAADSWLIKLNLIFVEDPEGKEGGISLSPNGDHAQLIFTNWTNTSERTSGTPMAIGETNGRKVSLLIAGYAIKKFHHLTLSFFWES